MAEADVGDGDVQQLNPISEGDAAGHGADTVAIADAEEDSAVEPRHGDEGLKRFKTRWSNRQEPVFLLRLVNDRAVYAELVRGREGERYFPAYRAA